MAGKRSAGQAIDSYCGKCKIDRSHTIVVMEMDGETVGKVRCNTCGSSHKLRSAPEPGASRSRKSKEAHLPLDPAAKQLLWETSLAEAKGRECPYSMAAKYRVGDIVNHQSFGKGVVQKLYPRKCDMLFKDGMRLMVSTNQ